MLAFCFVRFRSIVKEPEFYAAQANEEKVNDQQQQRRCYFYNVDLQGRLFLEETFPKNIATSIKDERFLDFFFRRVRSCDDDTKMQDFMRQHEIPIQDYPFVSPCGKELNFIRPAASPLVFHTLEGAAASVSSASSSSLSSTTSTTNHDRQQPPPQQLVYGGRIQEAFDWKQLAVCLLTGRIYHTISNHKGISHGLIRSQVAVALAERIEVLDDDTTKTRTTTTNTATGSDNWDFEETTRSELGIRLDDDTLIPIPALPADAEPGPWAMPSDLE